MGKGDSRIIRGDLDRVYDDSNATCHLIRAYIYSKGNIKTNSISNKFCNIEILKANKLFYLVITSGRLGGNENNIIVRRFNSDTIVRKCYMGECNRREREGYSQVEVVSIYPNCSEAAKAYVSSKNVISQETAKEIQKKKEAKEIQINTNVQIEDKIIQLEPEVEQLVKNIYFEANQTVIEMKKTLNPAILQANDTTPLGMINLNMINRGRDILKEIAQIQNKLVVAKRNISKYQEMIAELSNTYNSTIPRVFKRGSDGWLFKTSDQVMEQYEMLDMLELVLSTAVLNSNSSSSSDIISKYNALNSDLTLVEDRKIIQEIKEKMKIEQLQNHHFNTKLINVFEVNQKNAPTFDSSCGNIVTLFHGTRSANLFGILSTHIKLPHNLGSNIQITGHMFGPGVYFGQYSKSLQYARARFGGTRNKTNKFYMFLCDVALGKMKLELQSKSYGQAPQGYNSVMGVGKDSFKEGCYIKGINGTKDLKISRDSFYKSLSVRNSALLHNEFIVYNQNKFKIRYILEVEGV